MRKVEKGLDTKLTGSIMIACKYADEKMHPMNLWGGIGTSSDKVHTEIGYFRPCGGVDCEYKDAKDHPTFRFTPFHWVYYTSLCPFEPAERKIHPGVVRAVGKCYSSSMFMGNWNVYTIDVGVKWNQRSEAFLKRQMGKLYDYSRFQSILARRFFRFRLASTKEDLPPFRKEPEDEYPAKCDFPKWICSELVAHALLAGGALSPDDIDASTATPEDIMSALFRKYGDAPGVLKNEVLDESWNVSAQY